MKKLVLFFISSLFLFSARSQSRDSSSFNLSLSQAVDYAMKNQLSVQNADLDKQIAEAKRREIVGLGLPQINGSFDVSDFLDIPTSLIPAEFFQGKPGTYIGVQFGTQYNATAGLNASQLIFDGTFFLAVKAMKSFQEIADKSATRTRIEVASAVTKAYYNVLITEDRMLLLDANVVRLKKLQEDTKALLTTGFVEKIDLDRVNVAYNNLMTEQDKTKRFAILAYNMLKYQMGMDLKSGLKLTDKLEAIKFSSDALSADKFDPNKRIEFGMLQTQQKLNKLELQKNRVGYLPSIFAYGSASEAAYRPTFDVFDPGKKWYPTALVGVKLTMPIFDGGQKHFRVAQNKLNILKTENDLTSLSRGLNLEFENSKTMLINASNTLEVQKKNMDLATDIYSVTKKKYEAGVGSNLEVMNAETALKEAQTNYYSALYDALNAKVDFDKASGSLIK
jgi:outer membrane protein TolC